ncbi:MAG TPA: thiosulfate oxidation carrier protein SoxY [Beijerinckiaceae bacterium]|nr:thiosulfate oxidation carrier protein SoxY [Rhodoblastus sp.]MCB9998578.1 thiosulfate oxidation carrier protein SoxY [Methylobacteriaceae bacterium]MCC2100022.1 thiosulfate oxidation carrier protein SoxY [Hyphomicrobiales bacterium]HRY02293.1 thiosulfate oxidation carrier protein SoxY [Beijerinckiaceae bacterium]MCB1523067.1 thiosulfate oxidation carrier protein SoxY [Rhodoblastus sp.]
MLNQTSRRQLLKNGGLLGLIATFGAAIPRLAYAAWNKAAFEGKTLPDTYKAMGADGPKESGEVQLIASDIAENGAVVPLQCVSKLPNTTQIAFLVEKNPNMLAASFDIGPDMVADVTTRIKMGQTSNVIALVKADGKFYTATKEIKVTLGGCGG